MESRKNSPTISVDFKIVSISKNANSFGLHGHIIMARDGAAFQLGANRQSSAAFAHKRIGDIVRLERNAEATGVEAYHWAKAGAEIAEALATPSDLVVRDVWKN